MTIRIATIILAICALTSAPAVAQTTQPAATTQPAGEDRQVGHVGGEPIMLSELNTDMNIPAHGALHQRITGPLWEKWMQANAEKLKPTEAELASTRAWIEQQRQLAEQSRQQQLAQMKQALQGDQFTEQQKQQIQQQIDAMSQPMPPVSDQFAPWWVTNYKAQRMLYENFGGGRVIFQQTGLEALDAMHKWLKAQETAGAFAITDPDLKQKFYGYWTDMQHQVIPADQVEAEFLNPEWMPQSAPTTQPSATTQPAE